MKFKMYFSLNRCFFYGKWKIHANFKIFQMGEAQKILEKKNIEQLREN